MIPCNRLGLNDSRVVDGPHPLDIGREGTYCYILETSRVYTASNSIFSINRYINIPLFLPRGGIWIEGPMAAFEECKAKGYTFVSGGQPLLTRISREGNLEIFVRD